MSLQYRSIQDVAMDSHVLATRDGASKSGEVRVLFSLMAASRSAFGEAPVTKCAYDWFSTSAKKGFVSMGYLVDTPSPG